MNPADANPPATTWRHYSKAPIKEAILDIRIKQAASVDVFEALDLSGHGYPEKKKMLRGQLTIKSLDAGRVATSTQQDHMGFQFVGLDKKHLAQFRVDGFTVTRLAPYETWESLRDQAHRLWSVYSQSIGPSMEITRIALRYVNQLDMPMPIRDFRDYIRTYPEISSDLPQLLSNYFLQLQIPQSDGSMLILNEALVPPSDPAKVSVILDIDLFKESLTSIAVEQLWTILELLRARKNQIFEGCLTNAMRELIS